MKLKKNYLRIKRTIRTYITNALEHIGEIILYATEESPDEKTFNRMYKMCVTYHGICLFMFDYQLK